MSHNNSVEKKGDTQSDVGYQRQRKSMIINLSVGKRRRQREEHN